MAAPIRVLSSRTVDESWGPALKEAGLEFNTFSKPSEVRDLMADCYLLDLRHGHDHEILKFLHEKNPNSPVISLVKDTVDRKELVELRKSGVHELISEKTPAEELVVRVVAALKEATKEKNREYRSARRIWFQQEIEFTIFGKTHRAWSTTLSETGIFLRTQLNFPLYSVVGLKFQLFGESKIFQCEGVIVRQEVEGEITGIGIMFQNLSGEQIHSLESFLEICR